MRHDSLDEFSILSIRHDHHHQRQVPNYTSSCGAAMVPAQGTLFVRRSDSPTQTFWRREFSPNERDAAPIDLQQPNVELFPIRVGEPSQLLQLRQT